MRNIEDLHPRLREKVAELKRLCEEKGLKIGISECLRTKEEQDALYAKGRTAPGSIVTNAKGSTYSSMHQWGVAFDFYRNDGKGAYNDTDGFFTKVGEVGRRLGLEWGGDWKKPVDKPHFQLPDWGSTASILKKTYGVPEEFMKTWEENTMTEAERKKFNLLVETVEALTKRVDELTAKTEKVYHYTAELPSWARPTIQKLLDKGIFKGASESDLDLPEGLMRTLVINDRAGVYD